MKILLVTTLIINIIAILFLTMGFALSFRNNVNPKQKASLGVLIGLSMTLYIISMSLTMFFGLIKHNFVYLIFVLYIALPFVIGHFSNYGTRKICTIYQILSYFISLASLILFL